MICGNQCYTSTMQWKPNPNLYPPYLRGRIRQGRGIGQGLGYMRWLRIRDVPSRGTSSSVLGIRMQRPYHMLSELETTYFFLMERKASVIDIREQWPIFHIDRTLELCAEQSVRHNFRGAYPEPFTIDFLVTEEIDGKISHRAASIKTPEDAANPDIRRRLSVEHAWCQERGIPWALIDTSSFDKKLLDVLRFMRGWFRNRYHPEAWVVERLSNEFLHVHTTNASLKSLLSLTARRMCIADDLADNIFRFCAWSGRIPVSLRHPLLMNRPVVLDSATANA
jgi:hypothetical protein